MVIDTDKIATKDLHQLLVGSVAPRPIAFVSTVDQHGTSNLAPYSFFNVFSSNPPIAVFSSNRRVSNNSTKDTLANIEQTKECVINVVSYDIVRQMAITSIDYPTGVDEFEKGGFTKLESDVVRPYRVKESPVNMECKVKDIIPLGDSGGAGHIILCHIVRMHIDDDIMDSEGRIDPHKIDLMGRLGRAFYTRASGDAVQKIFQPFNVMGVGFDSLPEYIKKSPILTGNEIAEIAALPALPEVDQVSRSLYAKLETDQKRHFEAQKLIHQGLVEAAAKLLLSAE